MGFSRGYHKDLGPEMHNIDREKPEESLLARSLDGGETWTTENPLEKGYLVPRGEFLHGTEIPGVSLPPLLECPGGVDFTHPDFAMTLRMDNKDGGQSRYEYTHDRGKTWGGEIVLRSGGGGRDMGYPRTVQRPDGNVVTAYYFWDEATGPERYIAATVWDPGAL